MAFESSSDLAESIAAAAPPDMQGLSPTMQIHEICIVRPAVLAYLDTIPSSKRSIAILHALDVGVTELLARRQRFRA